MRKKQSEIREEWIERKHNWLIKNHHLNSRLDTAENQFNEVKDKFKTFSIIHMGKFDRYWFIMTERNDQRKMHLKKVKVATNRTKMGYFLLNYFSIKGRN